MCSSDLGQVKNATTEAAVNLSYEGKTANVAVYATCVYENANILLTVNYEKLLDETVLLSPVDIYKKSIDIPNVKEEELHLAVYADGKCLVEYQPEPEEIPSIPEPAKAAKEPEAIMTNEELYLTGQHIEQYRHATYLPDPYYLEGDRKSVV